MGKKQKHPKTHLESRHGLPVDFSSMTQVMVTIAQLANEEEKNCAKWHGCYGQNPAKPGAMIETLVLTVSAHPSTDEISALGCDW